MENENLDNLIKEFLKPLFPEGEEDNQELQELIKALVSLMVLPDENFITIAPVFYESFEKTINEVDSQILLANIKKEGIEPEELIKTLINIADSIQSEQFNSISEIKKNFLTALLGIMCSAIEQATDSVKRIYNIPVQKLNNDVKLPAYAHITDSGLDVYALEDIIINPGEIKLIPIGIKVALPKGTELQVRPKSSLSLKSHLRIANAPGTVDEGYKDELGVIVENNASPIKEITYDFDEETHYPIITSIVTNPPIYITKGQKFAQLVLMEVSKVSWSEVENIEMFGSEDRGGGYGSTGAY